MFFTPAASVNESHCDIILLFALKHIPIPYSFSFLIYLVLGFFFCFGMLAESGKKHLKTQCEKDQMQKSCLA